jgi:hypothetical protein
VVLTILKNISQWEGLSHIWKIKNIPNHQPDTYINIHINITCLRNKSAILNLVDRIAIAGRSGSRLRRSTDGSTAADGNRQIPSVDFQSIILIVQVAKNRANKKGVRMGLCVKMEYHGVNGVPQKWIANSKVNNDKNLPKLTKIRFPLGSEMSTAQSSANPSPSPA